MTTTAITQTTPAPLATHDAPRPRAMRRKIIGGLLGAAALGTFTVAALSSATSGSADKPPAVSQELQWNTVPGGCLADLECYGDASQHPTLPPERPEPPGYMAVD